MINGKRDVYQSPKSLRGIKTSSCVMKVNNQLELQEDADMIVAVPQEKT